MKKCVMCGAMIPDGAKFCGECGAGLEQAANQIFDDIPDIGVGVAPTIPKVEGEICEPQMQQTSDTLNQPYTDQPYTDQPYDNQSYANQTYENQAYAQPQYVTYENPDYILKSAIEKMNNATTTWLVVGIVQIVLGALTLCGLVGIGPLVLGIWNVVQSSRMKKNIDYFRQNPSALPQYYMGQKGTIIIFLVINFIFGGLIGVLGSVMDLIACDYVMNNASAFQSYLPYQEGRI